MPSKYRVRKLFAPLVKKIAHFASICHLTPNQVTFGMVLAAGIAVGGYIVFSSLIWFAIWIFITGILDGVDGALARLNNKQSRTGGFLDSTMDRISEGILFLGFLVGPYPQINPETLQQLWIILVFLGYLFSVLISYTRARVDALFKDRSLSADTNIGMFGRSERLLALIGWCLMALWLPPIIALILFALLILGFFSMFLYRFLSYRKQIDTI